MRIFQKSYHDKKWFFLNESFKVNFSFLNINNITKTSSERESLGKIAHLEEWVTSKSITSKIVFSTNLKVMDFDRIHFRSSFFRRGRFFEVIDFLVTYFSKWPSFRNNPFFEVKHFSKRAIRKLPIFRNYRFLDDSFFELTVFSKWAIL